MLVPQGQRPTSFCVGSRAFDPVNVGLLTKSTVGRQLCGRPDELRCVAAWDQQSRTFLRGQGNRLKEAAAWRDRTRIDRRRTASACRVSQDSMSKALPADLYVGAATVGSFPPSRFIPLSAACTIAARARTSTSISLGSTSSLSRLPMTLPLTFPRARLPLRTSTRNSASQRPARSGAWSAGPCDRQSIEGVKCLADCGADRINNGSHECRRHSRRWVAKLCRTVCTVRRLFRFAAMWAERHAAYRTVASSGR
ncbi:hypothetical protein ABIA45_007212 [Bradyrhizobium sp. USDA 336]|uniref:Uncharacterized protein n=1 Tax=Bradyrhizobium yuanmingense TaxID=108015 RepID=A0ABV4GM71_9BRAD